MKDDFDENLIKELKNMNLKFAEDKLNAIASGLKDKIDEHRDELTDIIQKLKADFNKGKN